jgi:diadenosine tetraphosphate (Ap4A) HIT family hydrolase
MDHAVANCPFCLENGLFKGEIITETDGGFVTDALGSPGCYLVIPKTHTETVSDLPNSWWQEMKALMPHGVDDQSSFNISLNYGKNAGQTVAHLHFWIIPRTAGKPSSGKGFARLISEADRDVPATE